MKRISMNNLDAWVGNNGDYEKRDCFMLDVLTDIMNGKYTAEELRDDVISYNKN